MLRMQWMRRVNETACDHDIPFASNNMLILLFLLVYHLFVICLNLALFMNMYFIYYSHINYMLFNLSEAIKYDNLINRESWVQKYSY